MKKITGFLEYIKSSLDTHSQGASARKLTAFTIVSCIVMAHIVWVKYMFQTKDFSLLTTVLPIDYAFIGALLGMTTYESIKKKNANSQPEPIP